MTSGAKCLLGHWGNGAESLMGHLDFGVNCPLGHWGIEARCLGQTFCKATEISSIRWVCEKFCTYDGKKWTFSFKNDSFFAHYGQVFCKFCTYDRCFFHDLPWRAAPQSPGPHIHSNFPNEYTPPPRHLYIYRCLFLQAIAYSEMSQSSTNSSCSSVGSCLDLAFLSGV